jgi:hypothetical protein
LPPVTKGRQFPPQFSSFEKQLYFENAKLEEENARLRSVRGGWLQEASTPAVITGFVTAILSLIGLIINMMYNKAQAENRNWELIQSSFNWLAGEYKRETLALQLPSVFGTKRDAYRKTWLHLFSNQAVYLLADQFDRKAQDHKRELNEVLQRLDEELTLRRLMFKLIENKEIIEALQQDYLRYAIKKRLDDNTDGKYPLSTETGRITEELLKDWREKLST